MRAALIVAALSLASAAPRADVLSDHAAVVHASHYLGSAPVLEAVSPALAIFDVEDHASVGVPVPSESVVLAVETSRSARASPDGVTTGGVSWRGRPPNRIGRLAYALNCGDNGRASTRYPVVVLRV